MGKLWDGFFCEYLWENWLRYNGTTLYLITITNVCFFKSSNVNHQMSMLQNIDPPCTKSAEFVLHKTNKVGNSHGGLHHYETDSPSKFN